MISPEILRRYPFFARLNEEQLRVVAMVGDEDSAEANVLLFSERQPAEWLYLLVDGEIDLYHKAEETFQAKETKEFHVGNINPGEVFSLSSVIEPYILNASGRTSKPTRFLKFNAAELRRLMEQDCELGFLILQQINKALLERLTYTRIQLAAAWA